MPALRPIVVIAFGRLLNLRVCVRVNLCDEAASSRSPLIRSIAAHFHAAFYPPTC